MSAYDPNEGRNNADRAADASAALTAWALATGSYGDEADIRDLIADLLHLAASLGMDPEHEHRLALDSFAAEVNGYPEGCEPEDFRR